MKKFFCELCEGSDVRKENGMFVCQSCGCQYSLAEAKNLLRDVPDEGVPEQVVVSVEKAVPAVQVTAVNTAETIEKHLENARRAKSKEDWEETERYYNKVEELDPSNIEAVFYSAYAKARMSLIDSDIYRRQAVFKVLENSISLISDKYDVSKTAENVITITMLVNDLCTMIDSNFVYTITKNGYGEVKSTNADETYLLFGGLINAYAEMMQKIHKVDEQEIYYELSALLYSRERVVRINNGVGRTVLKYAMEKEELDALKAIRYRKYWDAHKEEYDSLLREKEQLMAEVKNVTAEIYELSGDQNFPEIIELDKKRAELNSLGIFAGKRKKELEEELVALRKALKVHEDEVMMRKTPLIAKKQQLETRLREIDFEISKER